MEGIALGPLAHVVKKTDLKRHRPRAESRGPPSLGERHCDINSVCLLPMLSAADNSWALGDGMAGRKGGYMCWQGWSSGLRSCQGDVGMENDGANLRKKARVALGWWQSQAGRQPGGSFRNSRAGAPAFCGRRGGVRCRLSDVVKVTPASGC